MNRNVLEMNHNETELIAFSSKQHTQKNEIRHLKTGFSYIKQFYRGFPICKKSRI